MDRWRGAFIAVLLTAVLAACDDAPEPRVADEPTSSSTPSSTPSSAAPSPTTTTTAPATPPALPVNAQENSAAGAKAFVRWWVDLVNYAQATGDTRALVAVNDSRCEGCSGLVSAIDEPYAQGGRIEGGEFSVGEVRELPADHEADWGGFAEGSVAPQTVVDGTGAEQTSSGSAIHIYAYVSWAGGRWGMRWFRAVVPA